MVPPASLRVSRVRRYSGYCRSTCHFVYGTLTLFGLPSQVILLCLAVPYSVLNPGCIATSGLPSFHFARRYFGNRVFFLFLRLLRCFSSPGSLPYVMDWRMDDWSSSSRVSPFRYLRIDGYLLLPAAFRSLSRLSSALSAKASTLRSYYLNLHRCVASQQWAARIFSKILGSSDPSFV